MWTLVAFQLALAQAPAAEAPARKPVAVVLSNRRPGVDALAGKIAQRVTDSLFRSGMRPLDHEASAAELKAAGYSDPRNCEAAPTCLSKLAVLLGPRAVVVGVDVGKVGKKLAIHLEAMAADQEPALASLDVTSSLEGWGDALAAPIVVFARQVQAGLVAGPVAPVVTPTAVAPGADAPRQVNLAPSPAEPLAAVESARPARRAPVGAWVATGGAVAAAGGAVALGLLASASKARFDASLVDLGNGQLGTRLTEAEARSLADAANLQAGGAIGAAVLGAALGATAAWLFVAD